MKIMFGATLDRVPPTYIQELGRMGFQYTDFMSKSNSPSVDRYINREMGILMNREMPVALATAKELIKSGEAKDEAAFIREYLTDMKSSLNAMVKEGEEDVARNALLQRYLRLSPYNRVFAKRQWEKENKGKKIDMTDAATLDTLLEYASSTKFLAKQR